MRRILRKAEPEFRLAAGLDLLTYLLYSIHDGGYYHEYDQEHCLLVEFMVIDSRHWVRAPSEISSASVVFVI